MLLGEGSSAVTITGWLAVYIGIVAFAFGTVFGSFLTCLEGRVLQHESFVRGRSRCDACGHALGAADLVPVLSWLCLRGRCRYCGAKIPARDVIAEALLGAGFVGCVLRFGVNAEGIRWMGCLCCLLVLSLFDLDTWTIPDGTWIAMLVIYAATLPFTGCGQSAALLARRLPPLPAQLLSGLAGGALLFGGMLAVSVIFDKVTGKESLGGGDIKLFFAVGLYLGPWKGLLCLILACVIGLAAGAVVHQRKIPFGPSIAAAMTVAAFFGEPVVQWYLGLLGL